MAMHTETMIAPYSITKDTAVFVTKNTVVLIRIISLIPKSSVIHGQTF